MLPQSITSRLIVLLTFSVGLILATGMAVDYRLSRNEIISRVQQESSSAITGVVSDLENWLERTEDSTLFLGRILQQREYTLIGLEQMLKDIVENNDDIYGATIALNPKRTDLAKGFAPYYYRNDDVLRYADLSAGPERYWQRPWYAEAVAAGKPVWVEPYFDKGGGETLMTTFSVPVFRSDDDGSSYLYAVVTADIELHELHLFLQRLHLGKSGFGMLLSRSGIILSAPDPSSIMSHYLDGASETANTIAWRQIVDKALQRQGTTRDVQCPHQQDDCIVRMSALQTTGWPVGIIYAEDEILAPLRKFQLKTALLGLLTLGALTLIITVVSRRLTRPLTALAEITDQIAHGKLDVPLPRVQGKDEVARLISAFAAMKKNLGIYINDLEAETAARSRLVGELSTAREIQMAMLPQGGDALEIQKHYSLWAKVRPAKSVGGDLYTFYHDGTGRLFFSVGDVSDKGVPAALFMAKTLSHIQQYSDAFAQPAKGMALLNNALEAGNSNCMFVTLFFGVLDIASGELRYASAGHTPPCLVRQGKSQPLEQERGPALGLAADLEFPENRASLQAGDRLVIYTDGIDEAFNEQGQMFGHERLERELEHLDGGDITEAGKTIIQNVDSFTGEAPQSDDITLLLLDIPQAVQDHTACSSTFRTGPQLASRVADWVQDALHTYTDNTVFIMELVLVSEEVATNIDKYAQLPEPGEFDIALELKEQIISMTFTDSGIAFNPLVDTTGATLGVEIDSAEIGGLGVHLLTKLTDDRRYQRSGDHNILSVFKALS